MNKNKEYDNLIDMRSVEECYFEMNDMRDLALEKRKLQKGFLDLEDMVQSTMEVYAIQCDRFLPSGEEIACLDEAFWRLARGAVFLVAGRERYASVRHQLYGEPECSAPENYQAIILQAMEEARKKLVHRANEGRYASVEQMVEDAKILGNYYLKEDKEFWLEMRYFLFQTNPEG